MLYSENRPRFCEDIPLAFLTLTLSPWLIPQSEEGAVKTVDYSLFKLKHRKILWIVHVLRNHQG